MLHTSRPTCHQTWCLYLTWQWHSILLTLAVHKEEQQTAHYMPRWNMQVSQNAYWNTASCAGLPICNYGQLLRNLHYCVTLSTELARCSIATMAFTVSASAIWRARDRSTVRQSANTAWLVLPQTLLTLHCCISWLTDGSRLVFAIQQSLSTQQASPARIQNKNAWPLLDQVIVLFDLTWSTEGLKVIAEVWNNVQTRVQVQHITQLHVQRSSKCSFTVWLATEGYHRINSRCIQQIKWV